MFERNIYDSYGLFCEERFFIGDYEAFQAEGRSFLLLPKEELFIAEHDMLTMIDYLHSVGDETVLKPLMTSRGDYVSTIDGQSVYVCTLPSLDERETRTVDLYDITSIASELASLHQNGKLVLGHQRETEFFGKWPYLWEARVDQLEEWYEQLLQEGPKSDVDEAFLFTFPYFLGLAENAIQYVVDATLDVFDYDVPTICHRRFHDRTWLVLSERGHYAKRPTEFVYDHPCRDLAEWIRAHKDELDSVKTFLHVYEQYEKLSTYGRCLLFARLAFPLHYFEVIEHYYRSQVREMREEAAAKFFELLRLEPMNEQFLRAFSEEVLNQALELPRVDWL